MGGTCVNRGCIPSKVWLRVAYLLHSIRKGDEFDINTSVGQLAFKAIVARKNRVSADIRIGMESLLGNNGVELVRGRAVLKSPREVDVDGTTLEAGKIILATGSCLNTPDVPDLEEAALSTDHVLEMIDLLSSMLVWGSGPIEVEMATLLNTFGCKVILVSESRRILPREDGDTSQRLSKVLMEQGVDLILGFTLKSVRK